MSSATGQEGEVEGDEGAGVGGEPAVGGEGQQAREDERREGARQGVAPGEGGAAVAEGERQHERAADRGGDGGGARGVLGVAGPAQRAPPGGEDERVGAGRRRQ